MYKILNWLKRDYRNVSEACYYITKGRTPKWVIAIYYVVMFPIGMFLTPIVIVYGMYLRLKLNKIIREVGED